MKRVICALAFVLVCALPLPALADIQLTASGDAVVESVLPTTNRNSEPLTYGSGTQRTSIAFFQFNLTGINLATITGATLKVSWGSPGPEPRTDPGDAFAYTAAQLPLVFGLNTSAGSWAETTITYNNAPGIDHSGGLTGALAGSTTPVGVIYPTSGISGTTLARVPF